MGKDGFGKEVTSLVLEIGVKSPMSIETKKVI